MRKSGRAVATISSRTTAAAPVDRQRDSAGQRLVYFPLGTTSSWSAEQLPGSSKPVGGSRHGEPCHCPYWPTRRCAGHLPCRLQEQAGANASEGTRCATLSMLRSRRHLASDPGDPHQPVTIEVTSPRGFIPLGLLFPDEIESSPGPKRSLRLRANAIDWPGAEFGPDWRGRNSLQLHLRHCAFENRAFRIRRRRRMLGHRSRMGR